MDILLTDLKRRVFKDEVDSNTLSKMDDFLEMILDSYDHTKMTIFTRLLEIMLETNPSKRVLSILKVVDLIKFPIKKGV